MSSQSRLAGLTDRSTDLSAGRPLRVWLIGMIAMFALLAAGCGVEDDSDGASSGDAATEEQPSETEADASADAGDGDETAEDNDQTASAVSGEPLTTEQNFDPVTGEPVAAEQNVDPATGEPLPAEQDLDPVTGEPLPAEQNFDPVTGEPIVADEQAIDPETGEPMLDPVTGEAVLVKDEAIDPVTGEPVPDGQLPAAEPAPTPSILESDIGLVDRTGTLFRPFADTSPWNTPVTESAIDPNSEELLQQAAVRVTTIPGSEFEETDGTSFAPDGVRLDRSESTVRKRNLADESLFVNTDNWTVPIVTEEGGIATAIVCRQRECGPTAETITSLMIPPDVDPVPGNDGWFTVLNIGLGVGYDLWRARREGSVISYQFIKQWDLNGPGFSSPTSATDPVAAVEAVSARGSGLPLFAGVVQPEELLDGAIDHALAISVPGPAQRRFVQPASVTNGLNPIDSLPEGARIRLRTDADLRRRVPNGANQRSREILIEALQTYGAIVVDRSETPTLYARRNADFDKPAGTRLGRGGRDEVGPEAGLVDEPRIERDRKINNTKLKLDRLLGRGRFARDPDADAPLLFGNELQGIQLEDFEVISLGRLYADPPEFIVEFE